MTLVLLLGLVNWLATVIVVDAEVFAGVRRRARRWAFDHRRPSALMRSYLSINPSRLAHAVGRALGKPTWRDKVAYLLDCHLCAGTWIGLALGAINGGPFRVRFIGWILAGLTYKAIGHLTLEVVAVLRRLAMPAVPATIVVNNGRQGNLPPRPTFSDEVLRSGVIGNWPGI